MENFNKEVYLGICDTIMSKEPEFEAGAPKAVDRGFDNIIMTAAGGTMARFFPVVWVMKQYSSVPVYLVNSADIVVDTPNYLSEKSLVLSASNSGNTKEINEALKIARERGAMVLSVGDPAECPLKDLSDNYVSAPINLGEDMYLTFFMLGLSVLYKKGDFPNYPVWVEEVKDLHKNLVPLKEKFDLVAPEIAKKIAKSPYVMMTSSGILEKIAYWYTLCVLEEAQWIRSYPVSSQDFFHGALEMLDEDQFLFILKGVGKYRVLDERVENFAKKISNNVVVLDLADYEIAGSEEFKDLRSVFVAASLLSDRLEHHIEMVTGHSMAFRRYYRRMEY